MRNTSVENTIAANDSGPMESSFSAISWPAIIGGAFVAAAVSLILLFLGSGLGLTWASPWSRHGEGIASSTTAFTVKTVIWMIVMQWAASAFGGYLAGRLRSKWVGLHTDEVFFRDTAHGFLTWAVATVFTAAFLASAAASAISGGVHAASIVAAGASAGASAGATSNPSNYGGPMAYYIDTLFRSDHPAPDASDQEVHAESLRIIVTDMKNGAVPEADKAYLAQLVSARTGLSQPDAAHRVDDVLAQIDAAEAKMRQAAEAARKAGAYFALFTFLSMLIGAFIASVAAAIGGRHRDLY